MCCQDHGKLGSWQTFDNLDHSQHSRHMVVCVRKQTFERK